MTALPFIWIFYVFTSGSSSFESSFSLDSLGENPCITKGGFAGDTGLKVWCWQDISLPNHRGSKGAAFSSKQLHIDSECDEKQVSIIDNKIRFYLNPLEPESPEWCSRDYNMRAEIRTAPWQVRHAPGTEEWFGWRYDLGENYIIDQYNQWKFFQVYPGPRGLSPHISLEVIHKEQFKGHKAGEVFVTNKGANKECKYVGTGIIPKANESLDIVVYVIWGDSSNGHLQVWINGTSVYNEQVATITEEAPWGGNAKWGIYKWPWAKEEGVRKSVEQGIDHLETFMGPLRIITRKPGDVDYGEDSYALVFPG